MHASWHTAHISDDTSIWSKLEGCVCGFWLPDCLDRSHRVRSPLLLEVISVGVAVPLTNLASETQLDDALNDISNVAPASESCQKQE